MKIKLAKQTERDLEIWGVWCQIGGGHGLGFGSMLVEARLGGVDIERADQVGVLMDRCICQLIKHDPIAGELVKKYFSSENGLRVVSAEVGLSYRTAREVMGQGVAWIDGRRNIFEKSVA